MNFTQWIAYLQEQSLYAVLIVLALCVFTFVLIRYVVARWFVRLAGSSANKYDDVLM